jgi:ferredoxin-NADP reductase
MLPPARINWQQAIVTAVVEQTPTVKSYVLKPDMPFSFIAGQHVLVRLTAPDGYQAERSYSIASAPGPDTIELAIERLGDGEVSPFFHEVVAVGDPIEIRGPIGGHFNWSPQDGGPILLVGGGSGVVPLMSMLRHRELVAAPVPFVLVYSARHWRDVVFRDELMRYAGADDGFALILTLTRESMAVPGVRSGRIDRALIADALAKFAGTVPHISFVCGATAFVEVASMFLVEAGLPVGSIRTERYGGSPEPHIEQAEVAPEG